MAGIDIITEPPVEIASIDIEELQGSPTENYGGSGEGGGDTFTATRKLVCPWASRHELAQRLKGSVRGAGTQIIITRPHSFPEAPPALVSSVSISPFDDRVEAHEGDTRRASYTKALLTVQYAIPPFNSGAEGGGDGDPFVVESLEPWTEFLTRSHQKLYWGTAQSDPLIETEAPGFLVRGLEWVYVRHRLFQVPQAVLTLTGKVNETAIVSLKYGWQFEPETLLYNPPRLSWETYASGVSGVTLEMRFTYRPGGWNKFYRQGMVEPQVLYDESSEEIKLYEVGDFTELVG